MVRRGESRGGDLLVRWEQSLETAAAAARSQVEVEEWRTEVMGWEFLSGGLGRFLGSGQGGEGVVTAVHPPVSCLILGSPDATASVATHARFRGGDRVRSGGTGSGPLSLARDRN